MGRFQYNGAISGSILNTPLVNARFYEHFGQIILTSTTAEFRIANYGTTDNDEFFLKLKIAGADPKSRRGLHVCFHHMMQDLTRSRL